MQLAFWLPNIITALINMMLFLLIYRFRSKPGAASGLVMIGAIIGWSLTEGFLWVGLGMKWLILLCQIQYIFIISVIFSYLFFVIYFTGRGEKYSLGGMRSLFILPCFILIMLWTNGYHHLFYSTFEIIHQEGHLSFQIEYGPVFYLWSAYAYVLVMWSLVMLIRSYRESNIHLRKQYMAVIAGVLIPIAANITYIFNIYTSSQLDITPMAYTGTALFLAWAIFRQRMFDLQPIARREVFRLMSDSILVLDTQERIIDINPSASELFDLEEKCFIGCHVSDIFPDDPVLTSHVSKSGTHTFSILKDTDTKYYSLSNSEIKDKHGYLLGRIIVFRDITEQKALEKKLEIQAATDPLTGIMNRRYFTELSEKELARSHRKRTSLALLILDIDHFKSVNDHYGHHMGDRVLKALCDECGYCLRESDLLGRWGGEEFIILLPETDLNTAVTVAERIRRRIQNMKFSTSDSPDSEEFLALTISLGVTAMDSSEDSLDEAFKRADMALYRSKQEGRNRVSSD